MVVGGGGGRPREASEASSRAQILAWLPRPSPLPTPPGPLKLRLFRELRHPFGSDPFTKQLREIRT